MSFHPTTTPPWADTYRPSTDELLHHASEEGGSGHRPEESEPHRADGGTEEGGEL